MRDVLTLGSELDDTHRDKEHQNKNVFPDPLLFFPIFEKPFLWTGLRAGVRSRSSTDRRGIKDQRSSATRLHFIVNPGGVIYKLHMFELRQTPVFKKWFLGLKDQQAKEAIAKRLVRFEAGLLGDAKSLCGGVSEFRIQHGPGYRLYFSMLGKTIIILLCGGDKGSQARDILRARKLKKEIDNENHEV